MQKTVFGILFCPLLERTRCRNLCSAPGVEKANCVSTFTGQAVINLKVHGYAADSGSGAGTAVASCTAVLESHPGGGTWLACQLTNWNRIRRSWRSIGSA